MGLNCLGGHKNSSYGSYLDSVIGGILFHWYVITGFVINRYFLLTEEGRSVKLISSWK